MNSSDKERLDTLKLERLNIIFTLRNSLIEFFPEIENSDKYIITNELLNKLEQLIWEEQKDM